MKLVIRAESFESKQGSENAQVKAMIENCGLSNKVFTLDALHCSRETTQTIIESKNDYLVTVKGNQIKLYNRLKTLAKTEKLLTVNQSEEFSHGRCVSRKVSGFDGQNVNSKNYPHRQSFIEVERKGFRGKKEYHETLYYISSKRLTAEIFGEKIREHWLIENQVQSSLFIQTLDQVEYGFRQCKQELGWTDYRFTDFKNINKWWEIIMSAYLMISLHSLSCLPSLEAKLDNLQTQNINVNFYNHPQWHQENGWKNVLNNFRLVIQPTLLLWLIYPWLEIFPNSSLLLGFHDLINLMNQFQPLYYSG